MTNPSSPEKVLGRGPAENGSLAHPRALQPAELPAAPPAPPEKELPAGLVRVAPGAYFLGPAPPTRAPQRPPQLAAPVGQAGLHPSDSGPSGKPGRHAEVGPSQQSAREGSQPHPGPPTNRRQARVVVAAVGCGLAVSALGWAALAAMPTGAADSRTALPTVSPNAPALADGRAPAPSASPEWEEVLAALDATRAVAFGAGDRAALGQVNAPGSPAAAADLDLLERYLAAGARAAGMSTAVVAVTPDEVGAPPAGSPAGARLLKVADRRSGFRLIDSAGAVLNQEPAAGLRRWSVTMVPVVSAGGNGPQLATDPGWRVWAVEPIE